MHLRVLVTTQPGLIRTSISLMESDSGPEGNCQVLHGLQHRNTTSGEQSAEASGDGDKMPELAPTSPTNPLFSRLSPNLISIVIQFLSIVAFCALLIPYMQYTRAKKSTAHETCKTNAQTVYHENLARCDTDAATSISLRGGAVGLNWAEISGVIGVALTWQYLMWLLQGWMIVRICFVEHKDKGKQ